MKQPYNRKSGIDEYKGVARNTDDSDYINSDDNLEEASAFFSYSIVAELIGKADNAQDNVACYAKIGNLCQCGADVVNEGVAALEAGTYDGSNNSENNKSKSCLEAVVVLARLNKTYDSEDKRNQRHNCSADAENKCSCPEAKGCTCVFVSGICEHYQTHNSSGGKRYCSDDLEDFCGEELLHTICSVWKFHLFISPFIYESVLYLFSADFHTKIIIQVPAESALTNINYTLINQETQVIIMYLLNKLFRSAVYDNTLDLRDISLYD